MAGEIEPLRNVLFKIALKLSKCFCHKKFAVAIYLLYIFAFEVLFDIHHNIT